MNKKLIELLDLGADATEDQIVKAVADLVKAKPDPKTVSREKAIQERIRKSGGALTRENAALAIDSQEKNDRPRKAAK